MGGLRLPEGKAALLYKSNAGDLAAQTTKLAYSPKSVGWKLCLQCSRKNGAFRMEWLLRALVYMRFNHSGISGDWVARGVALLEKHCLLLTCSVLPHVMTQQGQLLWVPCPLIFLPKKKKTKTPKTMRQIYFF